MITLGPGDVVPMKRCTASFDNASYSFAAPKGKKFAFLLLGAGSPDAPLDANKALNALGWRFMPDEGAEVEIAAIATEARRAETLGSVHEGAGPKDIAHD